MNWVESLENPQAVSSLFSRAPDFSHIELHEVWLGRDGPVLRLRFDVTMVPSPLPRKWPKGSNTTQFVVAAWGIGSLQLTGWGTSMHGRLAVALVGPEAKLTFFSSECELNASFTALRVEKITGYIDGRDG